jgi:hypothetical protein
MYQLTRSHVKSEVSVAATTPGDPSGYIKYESECKTHVLLSIWVTIRGPKGRYYQQESKRNNIICNIIRIK